jgi:hypothetical protein
VCRGRGGGWGCGGDVVGWGGGGRGGYHDRTIPMRGPAGGGYVTVTP